MDWPPRHARLGGCSDKTSNFGPHAVERAPRLKPLSCSPFQVAGIEILSPDFLGRRVSDECVLGKAGDTVNERRLIML